MTRYSVTLEDSAKEQLQNLIDEFVELEEDGLGIDGVRKYHWRHDGNRNFNRSVMIEHAIKFFLENDGIDEVDV